MRARRLSNQPHTRPPVGTRRHSAPGRSGEGPDRDAREPQTGVSCEREKQFQVESPSRAARPPRMLTDVSRWTRASERVRCRRSPHRGVDSDRCGRCSEHRREGTLSPVRIAPPPPRSGGGLDPEPWRRHGEHGAEVRSTPAIPRTSRPSPPAVRSRPVAGARTIGPWRAPAARLPLGAIPRDGEVFFFFGVSSASRDPRRPGPRRLAAPRPHKAVELGALAAALVKVATQGWRPSRPQRARQRVSADRIGRRRAARGGHEAPLEATAGRRREGLEGRSGMIGAVAALGGGSGVARPTRTTAARLVVLTAAPGSAWRARIRPRTQTIASHAGTWSTSASPHRVGLRGFERIGRRESARTARPRDGQREHSGCGAG